MVKSTPSPKPSDPKLLFVAYLYALVLVGLVLFELVGFGGFDFAGIEFEVIGQPFWVFSLALVQVFALPFVLRLNLSPLARCFSAYFCLLAPVIFILYKAFGAVSLFGTADYAIGLAMLCFGTATFSLLGGRGMAKMPDQKSKN